MPLTSSNHAVQYLADHPLAPITLSYTRPTIVTQANTPAFKTPRRLSGRALISDSFEKMPYNPMGYNSRGTSYLTPGFGEYAHKDGYNVLYGDYGVRWHGDPEQRIIYWWPGSATEDAATLAHTSFMAANAWCDWPTLLSYADRQRYSAALVYNLFDNAAGIDIDVPFEASRTP